MLTLPWPCSRDPSLACLARTTRSTPRCLSPASPARVRWTEVTTRTPRPSAKPSTSAQLMVPEVSPSTASSAPTEPSSTSTASSATGGSTSTAPPLRTSTPSTTRLLQTPVPEKHQEVLRKAHMPPHLRKHQVLRPLVKLQNPPVRKPLTRGLALPLCTLRQAREGQGRSQEERQDDEKGRGREGREEKQGGKEDKANTEAKHAFS